MNGTIIDNAEPVTYGSLPILTTSFFLSVLLSFHLLFFLVCKVKETSATVQKGFEFLSVSLVEIILFEKDKCRIK